MFHLMNFFLFQQLCIKFNFGDKHHSLANFTVVHNGQIKLFYTKPQSSTTDVLVCAQCM